MSKSDELFALADRAKKLDPQQMPDSACFDLNAAICEAMDWKLYNVTECEWQSPDGHISQPLLYTTSFDAALTLVPEGHDWIVGDINGQMGGTPYAQVGPNVTCYAETAILSLVAAALAARANLLKVN